MNSTSTLATSTTCNRSAIHLQSDPAPLARITLLAPLALFAPLASKVSTLLPILLAFPATLPNTQAKRLVAKIITNARLPV